MAFSCFIIPFETNQRSRLFDKEASNMVSRNSWQLRMAFSFRMSHLCEQENASERVVNENVTRTLRCLSIGNIQNSYLTFHGEVLVELIDAAF